MTTQRINQFLLLIGLAGFCWPMMMLIHESGHALAAIATGGHVQRIVWYPLVFSRTDVNPNPKPLIVVWAGPIVGAIAPAAISACISAVRLSISYLISFFAGFCLIANGAYIGVGTFERVGDAKDMLRLGSPAWIMLLFGAVATICGLWIWHGVSPRLGLGSQPAYVRRDHAYGLLAVAVFICAIGFAFGNKGG
jgi:hypothetical protein